MERLSSIAQRVSTVDLRRGGPVAEERIRGHALTKIRERVLARDGAACKKCGKMVGRLEVDHIVPLAVGGSNSDLNLQLLCAIPCHRDKTLKEEKERDNKYLLT
jgi:5-methylcytosine-specific restriction protein A